MLLMRRETETRAVSASQARQRSGEESTDARSGGPQHCDVFHNYMTVYGTAYKMPSGSVRTDARMLTAYTCSSTVLVLSINHFALSTREHDRSAAQSHAATRLSCGPTIILLTPRMRMHGSMARRPCYSYAALLANKLTDEPCSRSIHKPVLLACYRDTIYNYTNCIGIYQ